jgi:hypothetical protein
LLLRFFTVELASFMRALYSSPWRLLFIIDFFSADAFAFSDASGRDYGRCSEMKKWTML